MSQPPSGTVTFLFTDIEGSTRRWEQHPAQMRSALSQHDAILRSAIDEQGGYVFKTVGDSFCAAFASPYAALSAALASQRDLLIAQWPEQIGAVKVRMALHTGAVDEQAGDYFGQPVNRVARLLSAGHGGQILLSEVTQGLVRDALPSGVQLKDLGHHRLRDLARPERTFQAITSAMDLPSDFPPLNTLDNRPNNLPIQLTPLIGREKEVSAACGMLRRPDVRLVTFTGPGGTGKTRLALQVAAESVDEFKDGVYFVNLAPIADPGLVASVIAQTLGVQEARSLLLVESLKDYLADKELLLLLDNFEQVIPAAPLVTELLKAAPDPTSRLKILVTSREVLRLYGEHEYPVSPLSLPDVRQLPPVERLTQYEAVRLFIERAVALKPDFEVSNETAPAVAQICYQLDGLPLAIELAAARIRLFPPQAILARLEKRLKLLTGGARDLPARQQTIRNTIEWSYDLLSDGEKQLFRRMAPFSGGRTLQALEVVCNYDGQLAIDVSEGVESLLSKSLLTRTALNSRGHSKQAPATSNRRDRCYNFGWVVLPVVLLAERVYL